MAEMVKFLKGYLKDLPSTRVDGTIYFVLPDPIEDKDKEGYNSVGRLYVGNTLIAETNMTDDGSVQSLIDAALANYYTKDEADKIHEDADKAIAEAIAAALKEAKDYADEHDSDTNTAHTHVNGAGTVVTAAGGISGEVAVNLNIGIKLENDNLIIYDKTSNTAIASMDAADLVEDSYLNDVTVTGDKKLKFTFTLNNGTTKTVDVDLESLVDVYTGSTGSEIVVNVEGYTVSASLTKAVTDDIEKGVAAYGWGDHSQVGYLTEHQDISGKADKVVDATEGNFAGLDANGNLTDSGKKASDFVSSEGYVPYSQDEKTKLAGIEAGAEVNQVIATGSSNGTISVDGTDVAVKGLADAAYTTVDSLNATAKGYADAVQGNTKVTVEQVVNALNKMNDKVGTVDSDNKAALGEISNIIEMLTWGEFPTKE